MKQIPLSMGFIAPHQELQIGCQIGNWSISHEVYSLSLSIQHIITEKALKSHISANLHHPTPRRFVGVKSPKKGIEHHLRHS